MSPVSATPLSFLHRVTTLSMAPNGDHFLSAAQDNTIKLWDLRNKDPQGQLKVVEPASVTYDNTGAVFAVMHNYNSTLALFDTRNFDAPPFLSKPVVDPILPQRSAPPRPPFNTSCTFSRDGKWILVGTSGATHYVLDAFDGNIVARLEGHQGFDKLTGKPQPAESGAEVCWSPDSRFVISGKLALLQKVPLPAHRYCHVCAGTGSKDGKVAVWDVNPPAPYAETGPNFTLQPMHMFAGGHDNEVRAVAFNPRLAMFATGSTELVSPHLFCFAPLWFKLTFYSQTLWTMAP